MNTNITNTIFLLLSEGDNETQIDIFIREKDAHAESDALEDQFADRSIFRIAVEPLSAVVLAEMFEDGEDNYSCIGIIEQLDGPEYAMERISKGGDRHKMAVKHIGRYMF